MSGTQREAFIQSGAAIVVMLDLIRACHFLSQPIRLPALVIKWGNPVPKQGAWQPDWAVQGATAVLRQIMRHAETRTRLHITVVAFCLTKVLYFQIAECNGSDLDTEQIVKGNFPTRSAFSRCQCCEPSSNFLGVRVVIYVFHQRRHNAGYAGVYRSSEETSSWTYISSAVTFPVASWLKFANCLADIAEMKGKAANALDQVDSLEVAADLASDILKIARSLEVSPQPTPTKPTCAQWCSSSLGNSMRSLQRYHSPHTTSQPHI